MTPDPAAGSAPGVLVTGAAEEEALAAVVVALRRLCAGGAELHLRAPPVLDASVADRAGYSTSFPHLLGAVSRGGAATDLVLTPAACYHVYPLFEGRVLAAPAEVSVLADCHRQEATTEPGRLRSFRMFETVRLGGAEDCLAWRDDRLDRLGHWMETLGLPAERRPANDPFWGRPGRLLASAQRADRLKWELSADVADGVRQAVVSVNHHKEHFGAAFGIRTADGEPAHTACLGVGLERLLLALHHAHGPTQERWPTHVRDALGLTRSCTN
ncbi:MAG: putative aminoacyl-tRNA synthetase [Nonomuraea muscovyensis]|nr:putative aminoacyl-tRNA synthetase [Nonomuraea muscovyensis]